MSIHNHPVQIPTKGLADHCPRCEEMAADPFSELDDGNLLQLVERTKAWMRDEEFPRSANESAAMRVVEGVLRKVGRLRQIGVEV